MGKRLVLADADFSANGLAPEVGVTWYVNECTDSPSTGSLQPANLANGGWAHKNGLNSNLQGKTINRIKLIPSAAGQMNIYKTSSYSGAVTLLGSFNIPANRIGLVTVFEFQDINIGASDIFVLGEANSVGGFYFVSGGSGYPGFYTKIPSSPLAVGAAYDMNISVGYYG